MTPGTWTFLIKGTINVTWQLEVSNYGIVNYTWHLVVSN